MELSALSILACSANSFPLSNVIVFTLFAIGIRDSIIAALTRSKVLLDTFLSPHSPSYVQPNLRLLACGRDQLLYRSPNARPSFVHRYEKVVRKLACDLQFVPFYLCRRHSASDVSFDTVSDGRVRHLESGQDKRVYKSSRG